MNENKTKEFLHLLTEKLIMTEDENGRFFRRLPDELTEYALNLLHDGKLKMKQAYSENIDWFGTVCAFDDGRWTTSKIVSNVKLKNFEDDEIYPVCLACATWKNGSHEIKTSVPMNNCEMIREGDGIHMKCGLWLSNLAFYLTPERYAEIAAIVRDKNMIPCVSVEVTYFNKSGVNAILAKLLEMTVSK